MLVSQVIFSLFVIAKVISPLIHILILMTGEESRSIRLCVCGRGQGQLLELPQEIDRSGEGGRSYWVRQHPMERIRGGTSRCPHEEVRQVLQRLRVGVQQSHRC